MATLKNLPNELRNSFDDLQLLGTRVGNEFMLQECRRLCGMASAMFVGQIMILETGICWEAAHRYAGETLVVVLWIRPSRLRLHANLLLACPCTGTYLLFDPHGTVSDNNAKTHQGAAEAFSRELYAVFRPWFTPDVPFTFAGTAQACPLIGPQTMEAVLYEEKNVKEEEASAGLCVLWSLFVLRAAALQGDALTVASFRALQRRMAQGKGRTLAELAGYCRELVALYGQPALTSRDTLPRRVDKTRKGLLVPRYNDPTDTGFLMSRVRKAMRSFNGTGVPRGFEVTVADRVYDMRAILLGCSSQDGWRQGAVRVAPGLLSPLGTPVPPAEFQRMTWTLACSALDLLPVPGIFFTMAGEERPAAGGLVAKLLYGVVYWPASATNMYTKYTADLEAEWRRRQQEFKRQLAAWEYRQPVTLMGALALGAIASCGTLLPLVAGGLVSGYAAYAAKRTVDVSYGNAKSRPAAPDRAAFDRQAPVDAQIRQAQADQLYYVYVKCLIHALLAVLDERARRLPPALRRRLQGDLAARTGRAVDADRADPRLRQVFAGLEGFRARLAPLDVAQLSALTTSLCRLVLFPLPAPGAAAGLVQEALS